jgi:hypothetical protein
VPLRAPAVDELGLVACPAMDWHRFRTPVTGAGLVGVIVVLWILAIPPSAGPDEPDHLVRGAALVRGQLEPGSDVEGGPTGFLVPPWVGWPSPSCFALSPFTPVSCMEDERPTGGDVRVSTRADDYQVWGHLLPGVGTLLPASISSTASRLLDASIPIGLIGVSLVLSARRGWLAAGGVLLAVTPMAWFTFAVVNPSGLVTAGAVAMWVWWSGLRDGRVAGSPWLLAAGFAAMSLPRRDGLFWAMLIISIGLLWSGVGLRSLWTLVGRGPASLMGVALLATLAWAGMSDSASARLLLAVPLLPLATVGVRRLWTDPRLATTVRRAGVAVMVTGVSAAAALVVMYRRPGGFDREVLRIIVNRTGLHLTEAIGVLGWLDTPLPATMNMLWLVALGMLAAAAVLVDDRASLLTAGSVIASSILASWVLEMAQGDPTGTYWQGRYYLPVLAGVPIVLASVRRPGVEQIGRGVVIAALVVLNVAFGAAMRRWGVGLAGPWVPWSWNTYGAPLPPMLLIALHGVASIGLWQWLGVVVQRDDRSDMPRTSSTSPSARGVRSPSVGAAHAERTSPRR